MTDLHKDYPEIVIGPSCSGVGKYGPVAEKPAKTFDELVHERNILCSRAMGMLYGIYDCHWFGKHHRAHAKELVDAHDAITEQLKRAK